jgi:acyl-CoA dehydrogenase
MAAGETIFSFALTETGSGTDLLGSLKMSARRDGDRFILNGQKLYTSNADQSDYILTMARTAPAGERSGYGLTLFIVPNEHPGLEIRKLDKLGGRAFSTTEVFYDDVDVSAADVLGTENEGFYQLLPTLNHERVTTAVQALGIGQAALDEMISYAKEREAFGRPIGQFQAIQHKIADSILDLSLARLAIYRAADRLDRGLDMKVDATAAKLVATEASFRVATRGMDVMAGMAFVKGGNMERYFRDIRQMLLGPVTNDMARNMIAESVGLPRSY